MNRKYAILALLVIVVAILACSKVTETPTNQSSPIEKPINISGTDLVREYKKNELSADTRYRGRRLSVSGRITNIADTLGNVTVALDGGDPIINIVCSFGDVERSAVEKLATGNTVTLVGNNDGFIAGLYISLNDCKVIQ